MAATTTTKTRWILEIAKGREPGRRYSLDGGETTLGNGPWAPSFISLADQEGDAPRKMAPRQAVLTLAGDILSIRDLESPGGTFVNRQRLFTKQERALVPGDVVQMGAIQLVIRSEAAKKPEPQPVATTSNGVARPAQAAEKPKPSPPPPPPRPTPPPVRTGPLSIPYAFQDGSACRTWDDFLTLSAQKWTTVRDELATGRIGEHLKRVGRTDLLPRREPGWSPDDVLDDWLGRLPTTKPATPELDVHPDELRVTSNTIGGVVRKSIRIANVGYRILRPTIAVEPAVGSPDSIRLAPGSKDKARAIIDEAEIVVEIEPPEGAFDATLGAVVVTAGGVSHRIGVRVERPRLETIPDLPEPVGSGWSPMRPLGDRLGGISVANRLWMFPVVVLALRGLVALGNRLPFLASGGEPRLIGAAAVPALAGAILGWAVGMSGGVRDSIASTFAGAVVGVLAASVVFAAMRSFEGLFGSPAISAAALGLALAVGSCLAFPPAKGGTV